MTIRSQFPPPPPAPEDYQPRRAAPRVLDEDDQVLDDHQRLHVASAALAEEWTARAASVGGWGVGVAEAGVLRRCADELTELLRSHR